MAQLKRGPNGIAWLRAERLERERSVRHLLYSQTTPDFLIEEDIQIRCSCSWTFKGVLSQLTGILLWNSYSRLPQIQAPTLVMHGDQDHLLPPQNGKIVASRIPGAEFVLLPNAGHLLTTDQPEATLQHLLGFLAVASWSGDRKPVTADEQPATTK